MNLTQDLLPWDFGTIYVEEHFSQADKCYLHHILCLGPLVRIANFNLHRFKLTDRFLLRRLTHPILPLYDEYGNYNVWWTDEEMQKYQELSKSIVNYYNQYEIMGSKVNGELTLMENIADLGRLLYSFIARFLHGFPAPHTFHLFPEYHIFHKMHRAACGRRR